MTDVTLTLRLVAVDSHVADVSVCDDGGWCGAITLGRSTWDELTGALVIEPGAELKVTVAALSVYRVKPPTRKG